MTKQLSDMTVQELLEAKASAEESLYQNKRLLARNIASKEVMTLVQENIAWAKKEIERTDQYINIRTS